MQQNDALKMIPCLEKRLGAPTSIPNIINNLQTKHAIFHDVSPVN
jgi:hypothetical protein